MSISSTGIGSGLDVQSIVSQLVAVESRPVRLLQSKSNTLQTKLSVFGQIKSELSSLKDAASALTSATGWDAKTFASDAATAVTGSVSTSALTGSFKVEVTSLAAPQSLLFNAFSPAVDPATNPLPAGFLNFQSGSWETGTFANKKDAKGVDVPSVSIEVKSTDTLTSLASRINSSSAGVSAVVVSTGGAQQLILRGTSTGTNSGFAVTPSYPPSPAASTGLEQLQYDNASKSTFVNTLTPAANAVLKVEGIAVTSQSNTVVDAVPGVTLNLLTPNSTANITVATDKDAIKAKIQAFQDAYNKLYADLKTQTAYDAASKTGGPLLGDNTSLGMMRMLRNLVGDSVSEANSPTLRRLSDLGLEIQSNGSLKTNSTKLDAALQTPANVKAFFSAATGKATEYGVAKRMYDFAFGALGVDGSVSSHNAAFQKSIDQNAATIDKFNVHIAAYQKQLLAQYNALDTNMAKLNSLSTYVSQQITTWNKSG
jgi:flagellar hook-associated protein 2